MMSLLPTTIQNVMWDTDLVGHWFRGHDDTTVCRKWSLWTANWCSTWASPSVETAGHHFPSTGFSRDHMIEFKRIRDARISDSVVETNRLVIRLEKVG